MRARVKKLLRMYVHYAPPSSGVIVFLFWRELRLPAFACIGFDYICVSVLGMDSQKVSVPGVLGTDIDDDSGRQLCMP